MVDLPVSRKLAISAGVTAYWTGKPCKNGHIAHRTVWKSNCAACEADSKQRRFAKVALYQKAYREKTKEKRSYYSRHVENKLPIPTRAAPLLCECCEKPCSSGRKLALDHCHETGAFRGWLCSKCNMSIGQLGDCLAGLMKAVGYLNKAGAYVAS